MNQNNTAQQVLTEPALMDLEKQVQRDIPRFGPNVHIGVRAGLLREMLSKLRAPVADTPRVDELMAKWDDDGATRGAAFIELRDLARELERRATPASAPALVVTANMVRLAREAYDKAEFPELNKWKRALHAALASAPVAREAIRDAALEEAAQLIESTEETLAEEKPQQFVLRLLPRKNRDSISVSGFAWAQAIRARKTNNKEQ